MKHATAPPAGVEPLYPQLVDSKSQMPDGTVDVAQQFRLQKIGELEAFLCAEVESRSRLNKKYHRAVYTIDGTCAALGATCIVTGAAGAGLLASGIGFVPGIALEVVTGVAGLFDVAGVAVSCRCSAKAAKHEAICVLAISKLNTVHSHIISDEEYKLVLEEIEKYRAMKEKIRRKNAPAVRSVIDEKIKKRADKARTRPNPCLVHQKANTKCGFRVSLNCVCVCTTKQTAQSSHRLPFRLLCRQHTEHSQRLGSITITLIIKRPNQRAIATAIRPYRRSIRVCLLPSHTFHCVSKNS